jgi:hypothetical protein
VLFKPLGLALAALSLRARRLGGAGLAEACAHAACSRGGAALSLGCPRAALLALPAAGAGREGSGAGSVVPGQSWTGDGGVAVYSASPAGTK